MQKHARVVAPASPLSIVDARIREVAEKNLLQIGWNVSFGRYAFAKNDGTARSIRKRVADIHEALVDDTVSHLMAAIGGWNSHELLPHIDWNLWRQYPKPIIGYSDITALQNALLVMSGGKSIHGPVFSTFGQPSHLSYTVDQFQRCVSGREYSLSQASEWLDDPWYQMTGDRESCPTSGFKVLSSGTATGRIVGGNLSTFMLLAGTKYFPPLAGAVVFLEEVGSTSPSMYRRWINQLSQQDGSGRIAGMVLGRFQRESQIHHSELSRVLHEAGFMCGIPIIADASFGHTYPVGSFPIGGCVHVVADKRTTKITIKKALV